MSHVNRVEFARLAEEADGKKSLNGMAFSGVAIETHNQFVIHEAEYLDGLLHGFSRSWSKGGVLIEEESYFLGYPHGCSCSWYESGVRSFFSVLCMGFALEVARWNSDGQQCLSKVANDIERSKITRLAIEKNFPPVMETPKYNNPIEPGVECQDDCTPPGLL
jgi:antitoxin component YwqK of YwqJK toxin-antitoxin module